MRREPWFQRTFDFNLPLSRFPDLVERLAQLGEQLTLPPWLEGDRGAIEAALPPLWSKP